MSQCSASEFLLKDTTFQIIAAVIEVHKILGAGFLESVYQKALVMELKLRGFDVKELTELSVRYKGDIVGTFIADIVVNDQVILELKAVDKIHPAHEAQLLNYLKATGIRVGLLVNFGRDKAEYKRFVL